MFCRILCFKGQRLEDLDLNFPAKTHPSVESLQSHPQSLQVLHILMILRIARRQFLIIPFSILLLVTAVQTAKYKINKQLLSGKIKRDGLEVALQDTCQI